MDLHDGRFARSASWTITALAITATVVAQPIQAPPAVIEPPKPVETPTADPTALPRPADGPSYPIGRLEVRYAEGYPHPVDIDELVGATEVGLSREKGALLVPPEGLEGAPVALLELTASGPGRRLSAGAINLVCRGLVAELNRRGVIGVQVIPDAGQINLRTLEDLRHPAREPDLRILILPAWVKSVDVVVAPDEEVGGEPQPSPRHAWIAERSPLKASDDPSVPGDAIQRDALDDYSRRLSRRPSRRVDATIAPAGNAGEVSLEYLVTESKSWLLLGQVSNTGTESTGDLRERFGFIHNQLTGNDDILTLDFITAEFDETNAFLGSYEGRFFETDGLRWRAYGNAQEYAASDVGFGDAAFTGNSWAIGGELIAPIFQRRELFVDLVGGVRFEEQEVDNQIAAITADSPFLFSYIGIDLERFTPTASTFGSLRLEWTLSELVGVDGDELDDFGRVDTDEDWVVLKFDISHSFFLEPLIYGASWADPEASVPHTLAHEIALSARGQYAFGHRLTPQAESVVGGFYSVRGYPEALVAGDSTVVGSVEYRFHVPRTFGIEPDPASTPFFGRPFRYRADRMFGYPDWDLVFKGFVDAGRAVNSDRQSFEENETLVGAGIGMELVLWRNLNVRVDWGVALTDVPGEVSSGDDRVHFMVTIQY